MGNWTKREYELGDYQYLGGVERFLAVAAADRQYGFPRGLRPGRRGYLIADKKPSPRAGGSTGRQDAGYDVTMFNGDLLRCPTGQKR